MVYDELTDGQRFIVKMLQQENAWTMYSAHHIQRNTYVHTYVSNASYWQNVAEYMFQARIMISIFQPDWRWPTWPWFISSLMGLSAIWQA